LEVLFESDMMGDTEEYRLEKMERWFLDFQPILESLNKLKKRMLHLL
tara:strand:+ start:500 stop:640 length:141 start_codon:yes stop_codon:yes gene_type:complete